MSDTNKAKTATELWPLFIDVSCHGVGFGSYFWHVTSPNDGLTDRLMAMVDRQQNIHAAALYVHTDGSIALGVAKLEGTSQATTSQAQFFTLGHVDDLEQVQEKMVLIFVRASETYAPHKNYELGLFTNAVRAAATEILSLWPRIDHLQAFTEAQKFITIPSRAPDPAQLAAPLVQTNQRRIQALMRRKHGKPKND